MKPELLDKWVGGKLLAFSGIDGKTDYEHGLVARTNFANTGITIQIPCKCEIYFDEFLPEKCEFSCDNFELTFRKGRNVKFAFIDAHHILIEGDCKVDSKSDVISIIQRDGKTLIAESTHLEKLKISSDINEIISARRQWLNSFDLPKGCNRYQRYTLSGAISQMKSQVSTPEGIIKHTWTAADRWPHRGMWLWDSAFHAIGYRHLDCTLAKDMLEALIDVQREDGFIPISVTPYEHHLPVTQPPVIALASKLVYEVCRDTEWLARIYPALVKYIEWDFNNHDVDKTGLVSWGTGQSEYTIRPSNASGMDNSPRFDTSFEFKAVDFNSYLASEYEVLAEFANILQKPEDEQEFTDKQNQLCNRINQYLWNEETKIYMDWDSSSGRHGDAISNAGFLPMLCGAASDKQADKLVKHLMNPSTFGVSFPVPTLAKSDKSYNDRDMWRGPTWINLNWMIARGLERYNYQKEANILRSKTIQIIDKYYQRFGTLFEFYDADDKTIPQELPRKGEMAPQVSPLHQVIFDYGWTATLYVDMVFTMCT